MASTSRLVFIDSGLLIAAARGTDLISQDALAVLADPTVRFATSHLVRLEVLPKAMYTNRAAEVEFYETVFGAVRVWAPLTQAVLDAAFAEATRHGLSAINSIHLAAATVVQAEAFITAEKTSKAIHRTNLLKVVSIAS